MARAPWPLAAIAAIYVATELWQVAARPSSMIGIRLAVYALVFLAALRGSRAAAWLWGAISAVAAIASGFALWTLISTRNAHGVGPATIAFIGFQAVFYAVGTAYIFGSRSLRAFQQARGALRGKGPAAPSQSPYDGARIALGSDALMLVRQGSVQTRVELAAIDAIAVRSQTMAEGLPRVWIEPCARRDGAQPLMAVTTLAGGFARFQAWLFELPGFDVTAYRQLIECGENARRVVWQRP
ncbi:hypothetical protein [Variovorax sp.]|jgi:hypothetical protein|uniref:hypothetical protein n=1 Tax=Variovorax sp. TaxID=1871043 RepID=UPI0037D9BDCA